MRVAIIGSGGIGGPYGAALVVAGADVTFVARGRHLAAMQKSGLRIEGTREIELPSVRATETPAEVGVVDLGRPRKLTAPAWSEQAARSSA
jgi:2-dehydropantoate 2-reductase